ncbi:lysozyme [Salipiger sp.]|uniref:lysozyme n=1 Tax=Salipiger sp. TaxID=2078585 RepID=UPI003A96A9D7
MRLIENWRAVAARAHSMWAIYLGIFCLVLPDLIYGLLDVDTSPRFWFWLALALLVYGAIGRIKDQGIDRTRTRSPIWVAGVVLALALGGALWTADGPAATGVAGIPDLAPSASPQSAERTFLSEAIPLVSRWEGLRTKAYRDPVGIWTVCYGETLGVKPTDTYTAEQCAAMLAERLIVFRAGLHPYFTAETRAGRLPPARDAAYVSLAYNVGVAGAGGSTATRRLNAGDIRGGCEALTWWNKAGGRVLRGLVNRRAEEKAMCLRGLAT